MKLVSLNCWGGNRYEPLRDFIRQQSQTADIFCLQEVTDAPEDNKNPETHGTRLHLLRELAEILSGFYPVFHSLSHDHDLEGAVDFDLPLGMATFVKKDFRILGQQLVPVLEAGQLGVVKSIHEVPRGLQVVKVQAGSHVVWVSNFHGAPFPGDKSDTPVRLLQSEKIMEALSAMPGPKILCGDFNLQPETQSVKILEQGMVNLIKDFNITNTRNEISWEKYGNRQYYADFMFVSPEIKTKSFEVPYLLASDHLPMILEYEI